jgi:endoglucanase
MGRPARERCLPLLTVLASLFSFPAWAANSDIRISSIGYVTDRAKFAAVINAGGAGAFQVRRASDYSVAFAGVLAPVVADETGDQVRKADFSAFVEQGLFYLNVDDLGRSPVFRIASDVTFNSFLLAMRGFYGWRCGSAVNLSDHGTLYSHGVCHLNDGFEYEPPNAARNGTGGWHDAGDFGKYVSNAAFSAAMMLAAWEDFSARLQPIALHEIPEAGDAMPDYLDEIRWELQWLLKMQAASGQVSEQVTAKDFEDFIMPEADAQTRYFLPWSATATATFAAVMAKAARVYAPYDAAFSNQCLTAATTSYNLLKVTVGDPYVRPVDVVTGDYHYDHTRAREWMYAELWETTGTAEYLTAFESGPLYFGTFWDWAEPRPLGQFVYLSSQRAGRDPAVVDELQTWALQVADELTGDRSKYGRAPIDYFWGGNGLVARVTMNLFVANRLAPNDAYLDAAMNQIAWLYGRNYYNRSQITGDGVNPPKNPHHRPSSADGIANPWPGLLVGGGLTSTDWVDVEADYQRNEVAINWNGALTYALAAFLPAHDPQSAELDFVSPAHGPANAETSVTIHGRNFQGGATVTFQGFSATNVVVVNSTTITANTPARPIGAVVVTVTNPAGAAGVLPDAYTYDPAYTDDPIVAQVTVIKAVHLLELRDAVNAVRARAGLAPLVFGDGVPAPGTVIRASHIIDLRNALNAALFPNPAYTDPALAPGNAVRAVHIQELRTYAR